LNLLLDTCVISEASKPRENILIRDWLSTQQPQSLYISALTIGEILYGTRRLGEGKRKRELEIWLETIRQDFDGRIIPLDEDVALCWGQLRVIHPNASLVDSQLPQRPSSMGSPWSHAMCGISVFRASPSSIRGRSDAE